jgi:hypothetical protein
MRRISIGLGVILFYTVHCSYAQNVNTEVVSFNVEAIQCGDISQYDLIIMVNIDDGWFVFSESSVNPPFHPLQILIHLPEGHIKNGDVTVQYAEPVKIAPDLIVYHGLVVLKQCVRIQAIQEPKTVECEIVYQAGDLNGFQPVQMKKMTFNL